MLPKLCPKLFSKAVAPKLRKAAPQSCCCPKLPAGLESCPKLLPKAVPRRCSPKLCPKAVLQSCCPKAAILQNLFTKTAPQSHSTKRLPKAAPQSYYQKLLSKAMAPKLQPFKPIHQNGSPKLFCNESCYWKLLPEDVCKAAPEGCCSSKQLFLKVAPDNLPKLLPKAAILQTYTNVSQKLFCKAAPESCSRKLLLKAAPRSSLCTGRT